VTGDTSIETQETFSLVVTPNSAIANGVDDAAGVAMIIDDDTTTDLPVISISSAEADEGDLAIFTVTLSEPSPFADVTVQFRSQPVRRSQRFRLIQATLEAQPATAPMKRTRTSLWCSQIPPTLFSQAANPR